MKSRWTPDDASLKLIQSQVFLIQELLIFSGYIGKRKSIKKLSIKSHQVFRQLLRHDKQLQYDIERFVPVAVFLLLKHKKMNSLVHISRQAQLICCSELNLHQTYYSQNMKDMKIFSVRNMKKFKLSKKKLELLHEVMKMLFKEKLYKESFDFPII